MPMQMPGTPARSRKQADSWTKRTLCVFIAVCCLLPRCLPAEASHEDSPELRQAIAAGSSALQEGRYAEAEKAFRDALRLDPRSVPLLNNLAICLARQQREDEAISLYQQALVLQPGDSITRRNLGVALFRAKQYERALPLLEAFAKSTRNYQALNLTGLDLFALDRYTEAARYLEEAHKLQPADLETLDILGKAYLRAKNYAGVTSVFKQIMAIQPDSAAAHAMMGMAYDKLYREDDAIKEYQAAETSDPSYPGVHTALGLIYWRSDNYDSAEREFRAELAHYPADPIANCTLGRILRRHNQTAEAIHYLHAALMENHTYLDALLELGEAEIAAQQPDAAIPPLQQAVTLKPDDAEAHFILGSALIKIGRSSEGAKERAICARLRASQRSKVATP